MARARWLLILGLLILGLLILASCTASPTASPTAMPTPVPQPTVGRTVITMGTVLQVHASGSGAHRGAEAAIREVLAADRRWSSWREDSQLSRLHGTPVGVPEVVDAAFRRGLLLAFAWSKRTDGAFDPTIGRLVELRRAGPPTAADLVRARSASGLSEFRIADGSVIRTGEARLAEGGFAKGLALDAAIATALDLDPDVRIELDLGGQLAWRHPGPRQPIAIADPDRRRTAVAWIDPPPSGSLATSGTSERGAHILDPPHRPAGPGLGCGHRAVHGRRRRVCRGLPLDSAVRARPGRRPRARPGLAPRRGPLSRTHA